MDQGDAGGQNKPGWTFSAGGQAPVGETPPPAPTQSATQVEWSASEYVAHAKGTTWYVSVLVVVLLAAMGTYWFMRDGVAAAVIVVVGIIFSVAAGRKPRVLSYRLDGQGLTISKKFYPYSDFKSFSVEDQGAFGSITFMPLKRFMPSISIYFAATDAPKIMQVLSEHLPFEPQQTGFVDAVTHRLRF